MSHFNMNRDQELFQEGCAAYVAYLKGKELTQVERMLAQCSPCMCGCADGKSLCKESSYCLFDHSPPSCPVEQKPKHEDKLEKVRRLLVKNGAH